MSNSNKENWYGTGNGTGFNFSKFYSPMMMFYNSEIPDTK